MNNWIKRVFILCAAAMLLGGFVIGGPMIYWSLKNSIFHSHPTYLPSQIYGPSLDSAGPGDLNPIVDQKTYYYHCRNESSLGFLISQYRLEKLNNLDIFDPNRQKPRSAGNVFLPLEGDKNVKVTSEEFNLINSQEVDHNNNTFIFKEYSSSKIPELVFEMSVKDNKIGIFIQTTSNCLPKNIAFEEFVKVVDSMN